MSARVVIVSSDSHIGLSLSRHKEYLESKYHSQLDEYVGRVSPLVDANARVKASVRTYLTVEKVERMRSFSDQVSTDNDRRLKELEADNVVGEVLFADGASVPFAGPFGYDQGMDATRTELAMAGQRSHNRWLAEFVDPARQVGVALVNYADIDAAVGDVYWAADAGLKSIALNGIQKDVVPPWDDSFTPLWRALEDTGLPISFHAGSGSSLPQPRLGAHSVDNPLEALRTMGPLMWAINLTEGLISSHRPLWFFIWSGILERHPALKLVFTEQGSGWIAKAVGFMDWQWQYSSHSERTLLPRPPSEYWQRQCYTGASIMTHYEVANRHDIGLSNMMFGTDFPHPEGTLGKTVKYLNHVLSSTDVTESEVRALLGENAARCYGLDWAHLQSLADPVGPLVEELLTPSGEEVDPETRMWAAKPSFLF
jgi:predicted TIM-barrel fold metal-dependent hydrolase